MGAPDTPELTQALLDSSSKDEQIAELRAQLVPLRLFASMVANIRKQWNADTGPQASVTAVHAVFAIYDSTVGAGK